MKILAHGIDLVEFGRLEQMLGRHGQRMLDRVFTVREQADAQHLRNRIERLAGRFAAKEAVMKLVGTGWRDGIAWTDVEVINDALGRPLVYICGRVKELADAQGIQQITLSITHTDRFAMASAVALADAMTPSEERPAHPDSE
ncbi:MAG TPA: holo-ACP synthase [Anaerohalosphaeraceae bacterium]|jgi:holo-[acyl-carrier protein] synthase|nr:holo-ACP synthase [Anaerohalosphaeraceae bacterium]